MSDWKALAISEANIAGCATDIVLATVEAETGGRNISGDSGNALGYGQVWKKWHMAEFVLAGTELHLIVPEDLPGLTALTLNNDQYSMRVTVKVIKKVWEAARGNWAKFTYSYVGAKIPTDDFIRRQNIWNKYHNSNFDYTGTPSFINNSYNVEIPSTNYGVVKGSAKSKGLLFGRRYRIIVSLSGKTAIDVSDMHCTFKCTKNMLTEPNYSQVVIYNLSAKTENAIIHEGSRIVIEAGYEGDQYGVIFDGNVLQPIREKEDGNTYKLTLICIDGDKFYSGAFLVSSAVKGQTARDIVNTCTNKGTVTAQQNFISDSLSKAKLTRGKVMFGSAKKYLRQVAKSENATLYLDNGMVNIVKAKDFNKNEIVELNPSTGLVGVPTQLNYGLTGKCLLNPRIKLNTLVHISGDLVKSQQASQTAQYTLDNDGIYRITQITYTGDTRGTEWYCDFETVSQAGTVPSIISGTSDTSASMW